MIFCQVFQPGGCPRVGRHRRGSPRYTKQPHALHCTGQMVILGVIATSLGPRSVRLVVGRLICWSLSLSVGWFVGRLVCRSVSLSVRLFVGRLVCRSVVLSVIIS